MVWFCVFRSVLDWFWINQRYFRLIESKFWSIENRIKSFLKTFVSHVFFTIQNFFKTPFSLFDRSRSQNKFLSFSFKIFARFFSFKASKTLLPLLFHLFSIFMHLGIFLNLREIGIFDDSSFIFGNWSMAFCCGTIQN